MSVCWVSAGATEWVTPESPPIVNIDTTPVAKSIAVVNLIFPPHMVASQFRIFTPVDLLDVSSAQLKYIGDQKLHQTVFTSWQGKELDTGTLEMSISGVPVNFLDYSYIMVVLLILLGFSVFMFYRLRLKKIK